jgi:glutamyl-tRNA reductase
MTAPTGVVTSVRVAHDEATLDEIEAASVEDRETALETLLARPTVEEAFYLQTCHRVEVYVVSSDREGAERALDAVLDTRTAGLFAGHVESLRHLLRVAAGLESVVIGEDQILGQLRSAAEEAQRIGALGPLLEPVVMKAIHVGERARSETAINEGAMSLGSAAVRFAGRQTTLSGANAVVLGAGDMGKIAAKVLAEDVGRLTILNRRPERASMITDSITCDITTEARGLTHRQDALNDADIVVSATASEEPILSEDDLGVAEDLVVVDLAQPRDVDPEADPSGVQIYDLGDVEDVTEEVEDQRLEAAEAVSAMVAEELQNLEEHLKRARADDVIAAMYESADAAKRREVRRALHRLESHGELTATQRETVEDLADALVNQLLAAPTRSLRDAAAEDDWETIDTALRLFDPSFEEGSPFSTDEETSSTEGVASEGTDD